MTPCVQRIGKLLHHSRSAISVYHLLMTGRVGLVIIRIIGSATPYTLNMDTQIKLQFPHHYQCCAALWALLFPWQLANRYLATFPCPCFGCTFIDLSLLKFLRAQNNAGCVFRSSNDVWSMKTVIMILKPVTTTIISLNQKIMNITATGCRPTLPLC